MAEKVSEMALLLYSERARENLLLSLLVTKPLTVKYDERAAEWTVIQRRGRKRVPTGNVETNRLADREKRERKKKMEET